jgi:acetyl esterase/lipase
MSVRVVLMLATGLALAGPVRADLPSLGDKIVTTTNIGEGVQAVGADSFATNSVAFAEGVSGYPDQTYATLSGYRPLKLDLFVPPAKFTKAGPRPVIVYIHGGGWAGGGPRRSGAYKDWPKVLASIAAQGYVVASVGYRFSGEAPFPAAAKDVKTAIRWLRANAAAYNIDKGRFVTFGQSAGGHLAALMAVTCKVAALEPDARVVPNARTVELAPSTVAGADSESDCVQGGVAWYGSFDFATMPDTPVQRAFLGCGASPCTAEKMATASPSTYVDESDPPMLLMHGTNDTTVPIGQSQAFDRLLREKGVSSRFVTIPDVEHSWIGKTPAVTTKTSLDALHLTLDYIDALIGDTAKSKR